MINELADLPENFMLVLDDYHHIQTPAIHQLFTRLLDHLPLTLHLVLTSRVDPPFSLTRLRSQGHLMDIRAADLRFSPVEVTDFLTLTVDSPLPAATAATLEARTEGWIAGLRLATISLQNHTNPEAFLNSFNQRLHRPVMEYLLDEVLAQQPAEIQDFLINTSILDRFCLSLGQAVFISTTFRLNPQDYLAWLQQTNLFLVSLDEVGQWYRYHQLFQELLQHRLEVRRSKAEIETLHQRAGCWLAQAGFIDEALG